MLYPWISVNNFGNFWKEAGHFVIKCSPNSLGARERKGGGARRASFLAPDWQRNPLLHHTVRLAFTETVRPWRTDRAAMARPRCQKYLLSRRTVPLVCLIPVADFLYLRNREQGLGRMHPLGSRSCKNTIGQPTVANTPSGALSGCYFSFHRKENART